MTRSQRFLAFARTTRGQVALIGILYGGALLLALGALSLRSAWFAGTVRERFPDAEKKPEAATARELARDIAAGRKEPDELHELGDEALLSVYGVLLDEPDADNEGRLLAAFREEQPETLRARVRRTLAAGNRAQRLRALEFLGTMSPLKFVSEGQTLCRYTLERARRHGETDVADAAARALRQFEPHLIP
jgi:hypothetical protein